MAILSSFDNEEREHYIGYVEAANGIGLLFGPLLGAMLYSFGGYMMPFATFAGLYTLSFPCIAVTLIQSQRILDQHQREGEGKSLLEQNNQKSPREDVPLMKLVRKPRFTFGLLA
jgi:MFS family permease